MSLVFGVFAPISFLTNHSLSSEIRRDQTNIKVMIVLKLFILIFDNNFLLFFEVRTIFLYNQLNLNN